MAEARVRSEKMLATGAPLQKWKEMLLAQGTDLDAFVVKLAKDHTAPVIVELKAPRGGFVSQADARIIGEVIRDLGGGRMTKEATVDFDVGIDRMAQRGQRVDVGSILCRIHARTQSQANEAAARLAAAFGISDEPFKVPPLIVEVL